MKKLSFLLFIMTACNAPTVNTTTLTDSSKAYPLHAALWDYPNYIPAMDSAMSLLDRSTAVIEKAIDNKISPKLSQKKSNELMDSFFTLYHKIPAKDTPIIYQYRIQLINKLIDYKMKHQ